MVPLDPFVDEPVDDSDEEEWLPHADKPKAPRPDRNVRREMVSGSWHGALVAPGAGVDAAATLRPGVPSMSEFGLFMVEFCQVRSPCKKRAVDRGCWT